MLPLQFVLESPILVVDILNPPSQTLYERHLTRTCEHTRTVRIDANFFAKRVFDAGGADEDDQLETGRRTTLVAPTVARSLICCRMIGGASSQIEDAKCELGHRDSRRKISWVTCTSAGNRWTLLDAIRQQIIRLEEGGEAVDILAQSDNTDYLS